MHRTGVPGARSPSSTGTASSTWPATGCRRETVDADTVFPPASLSEPLASTVIAGRMDPAVILLTAVVAAGRFPEEDATALAVGVTVTAGRDGRPLHRQPARAGRHGWSGTGRT
jgi:hypothetical protein